MDNQHREIKGYRELDASEIALMNVVKQAGADIGRVVEGMRLNPRLDQRWVAIGATEIQQGLMALTRSIAKPELF